ncbi:hypothetical protein AAFF_G00008250 [Aldrovandia affinis]|uniref:Uncharacterized protein n=1 Tax=Aldrovandia affinis TaxID=143900 RepID=A0AAD7T671_9TELE|nr:hypothetical protein AAFF_G00008250 [Aldrovandia affinis]
MKTDIWTEITKNVNATGSGQMGTVEQELKWKNLKAKPTKDNAEANKTQTGNKGDYTDVVLDIIGGKNSHALHRIPGVVGGDESKVAGGSEPVPPNADE